MGLVSFSGRWGVWSTGLETGATQDLSHSGADPSGQELG
jgi:hypothetical protein